MNRIILASHKDLSLGMFHTLEYIVGKVDNIELMIAYNQEDYDIETEINKLLKEGENYFVITDILGGSVNAKWLEYVETNNLSNNVTVISGMNLSLVIELYLNIGDPNLKDRVEEIIESSKNSIIDCTKLLEE